MAGEPLESHLTGLNVGRVATGDAGHADDGDEGRDQMLGPTQHVGAGRRLGQLDEDHVVSREGHPEDELNLPREVVELVGDHDDDVVVRHMLRGARGVLDRAGGVFFRQHVAVFGRQAGVAERGPSLAGRKLVARTVLLAVVSAGPQDADGGVRTEFLDDGRHVERLNHSTFVVGVERAVFHHATSTEVHDDDVGGGRELTVQVRLQGGAVESQHLH